MSRRLRSVTFPVSLPPTCKEAGCWKPPAYRVTTMGGPTLFCEPHARFYIARGPAIYLVERWGQPETGGTVGREQEHTP